MKKYSDAEKMYRYCMRNKLRFSYTEDNVFINVMFSENKSDKLLSYTYDKEYDKLFRLKIDDKDYVDVDTALRDFDEYRLLALS